MVHNVLSHHYCLAFMLVINKYTLEKVCVCQCLLSMMNFHY